MKKTKKPMSTKSKLRLSQASGVGLTFAPLAIGVGVNWQDYFTSRAAGTSLTIGGIMALVIVILQLAGKGKKIFGSGFVVTGVIFAMSIFLEPLIVNMKFLSGMMFLGEAMNSAITKPIAEKLQTKLGFETQAQTVREVFDGRTN